MEKPRFSSLISPSKKKDYLLKITHGPFSGECGVDGVSVVIWAKATLFKRRLMSLKQQRCQAPCSDIDDNGRRKFTFKIYDEDKLEVERKTVQAFESADYTMKVAFKGLQLGKLYTAIVDNRSCNFFTASAEDKSINFVFSSCLGGQGYGRNSQGWTIFQKMGYLSPHFFIFSGDTIYADCKIPKIPKLMDGSKQQNIPHDIICKTIDEIRDRYQYNLEDHLYAKFLSETPTYVLQDDHEITNDWGGKKLQAIDPELLKNGVKAFFEYQPVVGKAEASLIGRKLYRKFESGVAEFFFLDVRGYRSIHQKVSDDEPPQMLKILGDEQREQLITSLKSSNKLWKIIVSPCPLSYPTGQPEPEKTGFDGWSASLSLLDLIKEIRDSKVDNLLFVSGDVHFPYFLSYDPFHTGSPMFYEVGATPLRALSLPPTTPAKTLNPTVIWSEGVFARGPNNFGHVKVAKNGTIKIAIIAENGEELFTTSLNPKKTQLKEI